MKDLRIWLRVFAFVPLCFSLCLALGIDRLRALELTLMPLLSISTLHDQPGYDLLGPAYKPWQRTIDGRPYTPLSSHLNGTITGR